MILMRFAEYRFMLSIYDEVERILVADGEGDDAES